MSQVLVLGAAGMLGRRLLEELRYRDTTSITAVRAVDLNVDDLAGWDDSRVRAVSADMRNTDQAAAALEDRPEVIVHLASMVSGDAERDPNASGEVNVVSLMRLLERIRLISDYRPRLVFASSLAVFGAAHAEIISDETIVAPETTYGSQKAMAELALNDASRRGTVDAVSLRFATVCVRPGNANGAASGFFSSIIREPLRGVTTTLPVSDNTRHVFVSPRVAAAQLLHAMTLDTTSWGSRRSLVMPAVSATVREEMDALARHAGDGLLELIRREPDQDIADMVATWPRDVDAALARERGFPMDHSIDRIIADYVSETRPAQ